MATGTSSYSFQKPTVGGDADSWGTHLNNNWDSVDNLLDGGAMVTGMTITNAALTTPAVTRPTITGTITEDVYAVSSTAYTIDADNGSIQTWTLSANSTANGGSIAAGESVTLMVNDGSSYTITWSSVNWVGGSAPTLPTSNYAVIELWNVGGTVYASHVGNIS
mgnify:FL=1|jgi:hypothetical protein